MTSDKGPGRTRQKQRTRTALKAAAVELIAAGRGVSLEEVAEAAQVSRSTAYRYFPSIEALEAEVQLDTVIRDGIEKIHAAVSRAPENADRVTIAIHEDHALVTSHESAFRAALQTFVAPVSARTGQQPPRPGNRLGYLAEAVHPLRGQLGADRAAQLVAALALCVGIESVIVLQDICNLEQADAEQLKCWAANALLQQAIRDAADA